MVPIVIVAARAATIAQSLSRKSKMAIPLLHPPNLFVAEVAMIGVLTAATALASVLGSGTALASVLDSGMLMAEVDDIFGIILLGF